MTATRYDPSVDQPVAPVPETLVQGAAEALLAGQTQYVEAGGIAPAEMHAVLTRQCKIVSAALDEMGFVYGDRTNRMIWMESLS